MPTQKRTCHQSTFTFSQPQQPASIQYFHSRHFDATISNPFGENFPKFPVKSKFYRDSKFQCFSKTTKMVHAYPNHEDIDKRRANLTAIADVVNELIKEYDNVHCEPVTVPICCHSAYTDGVGEPPNVMVCYKVGKVKSSGAKAKKNTKNTNDNNARMMPLKQSKSRELRGSVMYVGCDCENRNGLQDDCQRTECHGSPECLTVPHPTCGPSQFSHGKHLGKSYMYGGYGHGTVSKGSHGSAHAAPTSGTKPENSGNDADSAEYEYRCFPANVVENNNDVGTNCLCNCEEAGNCDVCCGRHNAKRVDTFYANEKNDEEYLSPDGGSLATYDEDEATDVWDYAFLPANLTYSCPNTYRRRWFQSYLPYPNMYNVPGDCYYLPYPNTCKVPGNCYCIPYPDTYDTPQSSNYLIENDTKDEHWPCRCEPRTVSRLYDVFNVAESTLSGYRSSAVAAASGISPGKWAGIRRAVPVGGGG
ncbi:hypothetical protein Trydic_g17393 [Trypoxylus dichotomus]